MVETPSQARWDILYVGTVQGVGFRYTARAIATRLAVAGYVKNLADGRVQLVAEGDPEELARLEEAIDQALGRYIARSTRSVWPATGEFEGFDIRF